MKFKLQSILNFIEEKIFNVVCTVSLLAIMLFTSFDVLARKLINFTIPSLFEFTAEYLMVALVFLPMSYIYAKNRNIRVTLFLGLIPKAIKPALDRLLKLSALVLCGLIAILGWENMVDAFRFNEVSSSLVAYPLGPAYLLIPIGFGMLCIRIIQSLIFPQSIEKHNKTIEEKN